MIEKINKNKDALNLWWFWFIFIYAISVIAYSIFFNGLT